MLGTTGTRQYLGSASRMLEPPANMWLYRTVVFLRSIPIWVLRRPDALSATDLWKALSGDVGPLPLAQLSLNGRGPIVLGAQDDDLITSTLRDVTRAKPEEPMTVNRDATLS